MPGYSDTRQLIIDTLMGRPAGTEIQPEDHQAFALALTDYIRSVELVAGTAVPIAFAEPDTIPIQPDNGKCFYISTVSSSATVTYENFIGFSGSPITVTTGDNEMAFITLIWNSAYWDVQVNYVDIIPSYIRTTWEELQEKRDHDDLLPGGRYRITDYHTTTVAENTQSADHQFDIIVTALDSRTISEEASAILHDYDYFDGSTRLDAWKIWYCLDNDTERFHWADPDGKGVIYRMIDEYGNDCPYDFKNILFRRDFYSDGSLAPEGEGDYSLYLYTFSYIAEGDVILDASIFGNNGTLLDDEAQISGVTGNKIEPRIDSLYLIWDPSKPTQILNNIVFYASWADDGELYYGCNNNTFEANCYNNTFGYDCSYNSFGINCNENIIAKNFKSNTFEANCSYNKFFEYNEGNSFGCNFVSNILTGCTLNTFKKSCYGNELEGCAHNTFDDSFADNYLVTCDYNYFSKECYNNYLTSVHRSNFGTSCGENIITNSEHNTFSPKNWGVKFSGISWVEAEYDPYEDGAIIRIKDNGLADLPARAFSSSDNNIIKIYLPENVTTIGDYAFEWCAYLTTIDMGSTVNIGEGVFDGCDNLQYLYSRMREESEYGNRCIESQSLLEDLEVITFVPKGCEQANAVNSTLFTKFVGYDFPSDKPTKRVESPCQIWYTTHQNVPLEFRYVEEAPYYHHFQDGVGIIGLEPDNCIIPERLFEGENMLREVYIPKEVQAIPYRCFYGCSNLENVYGLEDSSVWVIGSEAFSGCSRLRSLSFPRTIESVGNEAFYDCWSLEQLRGVLESDDLDILGNDCLSRTALQNITFPSNIRETNEQILNAAISIEFKGAIEAVYIETEGVTMERIKLEDVSAIRGFYIEAASISEIFIEKGGHSNANFSIDAQISKIYCKCVDIPVTFDFISSQDNCKLYVPSGSVSAYQAALSDMGDIGNISVIGVKFVSPEGILIE